MVIAVLLLNSQLTNECSKISEYMTFKLMREWFVVDLTTIEEIAANIISKLRMQD